MKFDPARHDIVCVDRQTGQHFHLSMPDFSAAEAAYEKHQVDESGLRAWAEGLERRISELQSAQKAVPSMADVQHAFTDVDSLRQRLSVMEDKQKMHDERLLEAAKRVDFVMKEGGGRAELTQEELS